MSVLGWSPGNVNNRERDLTGSIGVPNEGVEEVQKRVHSGEITSEETGEINSNV